MPKFAVYVQEHSVKVVYLEARNAHEAEMKAKFPQCGQWRELTSSRFTVARELTK